MTLEQYLELESRSQTRREYFAGEIFEIERLQARATVMVLDERRVLLEL